jgi:hypothetical protein
MYAEGWGNGGTYGGLARGFTDLFSEHGGGEARSGGAGGGREEWRGWVGVGSFEASWELGSCSWCSPGHARVRTSSRIEEVGEETEEEGRHAFRKQHGERGV